MEADLSDPVPDDVSARIARELQEQEEAIALVWSGQFDQQAAEYAKLWRCAADDLLAAAGLAGIFDGSST